MKKMLLALLALGFLSTATIAQDKKADKAKPAAAAKKAEPAKAAAPAAAPAKAAPAAGPLKKDGTPDMRNKANKEAAKPAAGPLKKMAHLICAIKRIRMLPRKSSNWFFIA